MDLGRDSAVLQEYNQALRAIIHSTNGEELAMTDLFEGLHPLYSQPHGSLEIEVRGNLCQAVRYVQSHRSVHVGTPLRS